MSATKMEVDPTTSASSTNLSCNVMASPGTTGSVSVSLHPLVVMNISEHWTRVKAQTGQLTVIGALIGKQTGRKLEVMNSFELMFDQIDGDYLINMDYYKLKEEQFKQVFSEMDFLGWYTTGKSMTSVEIKIHKQIIEINESPVCLVMNPQASNSHLPVMIYESVIDLVNGEATMLFVELQYTLATEEAERIGVDHVARVSTTDASDCSLVAEHLQAQHSSVKMLHSRVKVILDYVKAAQAGEVPVDHDILREAYSLCYRLPVINTPKFKGDFFNQCSDVTLMAYLGTITKGCNTINQFVNKFNVLYGREGMGRRMRGLFF